MPIGYTMAILNCTLLNFAHADMLSSIFENYSNDFEYTTNGIFRIIVSPDCPKCGKNHTDKWARSLQNALWGVQPQNQRKILQVLTEKFKTSDI